MMRISAIKPMNCQGMLVYKSQPHSYRKPPSGWLRLDWCTAMRNPGASRIDASDVLIRMMPIYS